jgi:hypothetical protein
MKVITELKAAVTTEPSSSTAAVLRSALGNFAQSLRLVCVVQPQLFSCEGPRLDIKIVSADTGHVFAITDTFGILRRESTIVSPPKRRLARNDDSNERFLSVN